MMTQDTLSGQNADSAATEAGVALLKEGRLEEAVACLREVLVAAPDNVFVERPWMSMKYEEVHLHAYESVSQAKAGIGRYFAFYNVRRPYSSLNRMTPDQFYFK